MIRWKVSHTDRPTEKPTDRPTEEPTEEPTDPPVIYTGNKLLLISRYWKKKLPRNFRPTWLSSTFSIKSSYRSHTKQDSKNWRRAFDPTYLFGNMLHIKTLTTHYFSIIIWTSYKIYWCRSMNAWAANKNIISNQIPFMFAVDGRYPLIRRSYDEWNDTRYFIFERFG